MTDTATPVEKVVEHCSDHATYDNDCQKCRKANMPERRGAPPLTKEEMSRQIGEIIAAARRIEDVYDELYDMQYEKQVSGEGGGGSGTSKPTEGALVNGRAIRERLMEASDKIAGRRDAKDQAPGALALVTGGLNAIDEAMKVVDLRHAATFDPAEQLREHPADRASVLDSYRRKARRLRAEDPCALATEARALEGRIDQIESAILKEAKDRASAEAKLAGKKGTSKGRAKRTRNGWNSGR